MYAIVDIETTGGNPVRDKITEIAIYVHDGYNIINEFATLINPECDIPYYITKLTGITNEMVADSPKFFEVAKDIVKMTENTIFVAHNVSFDYNFIRNEFKNLGYDFKLEKLCTVRMSRKFFPNKRSYSLGNICNDLGIKIEDRHRAAGDALATTRLLELILKSNGQEKPLSLYTVNENELKGINKSVNHELLSKLPEEAGVYYFHNSHNDIIYIGKSKNIRQRVISHLSNQSKRALEMKSELFDISFELTGSELIALLTESDEIKKFKPKFNRSQRRTIATYGIFSFKDKNGYINLELKKINKDDESLTSFTSLSESRRQIYRFIEEFKLCQQLCGLYKSDYGCFQYQIGQCNGACVCKESNILYNQRVLHLIDKLKYVQPNVLLIDKGRNENEKSVAIVENGKYLGFGYIDNTMKFNSIDEIKDSIKYMDDNRDIRQILNLYIRNRLVEKTIIF
ncbi:MAG: exonuclease domain-containing protein [Bacteroidota bacterium]